MKKSAKKSDRKTARPINVKVNIAAKNPARKNLINPKLSITRVKRNPVNHWVISAVTREGDEFYFTGTKWSQSRRDARQYQTKADARKVAKILLPSMPYSVKHLKVSEHV